jgi:hypothetical protein
MVLTRYAVALAAGTLLSGLAAGLLGSLGPSAGFPPLSRNLWADYRALGGAPFGSAMGLFALSAVIFTACLLVAGWPACRRARAAQPPASEAPEPDREDRSVPC